MSNIFDWMGKICTNIYKEEESKPMLVLQNPYQQCAGISNNTVTIPVAQGGYISTTGMYGNNQLGQYVQIPYNAQQAIPTTYGIQSGTGTINVPLANPSNQLVSIVFLDANGVGHDLCVDAAYISLLHQISAYSRSTGILTSAPKPKMLDGDFSEDEMEIAEQLIQEMSLGKNSESRQQA